MLQNLQIAYTINSVQSKKSFFCGLFCLNANSIYIWNWQSNFCRFNFSRLGILLNFVVLRTAESCNLANCNFNKKRNFAQTCGAMAVSGSKWQSAGNAQSQSLITRRLNGKVSRKITFCYFALFARSERLFSNQLHLMFAVFFWVEFQPIFMLWQLDITTPQNNFCSCQSGSSLPVPTCNRPL